MFDCRSVSLDGSLLVTENSVVSSSSIVKAGSLGQAPGDSKVNSEVELFCTEETKPEKTNSSDWSPPLQLSSYNLTKPSQMMAAKIPVIRTETLERHNSRPSLRTFTSGRCSAEPLESYKLSSAKNELRGRPGMDDQISMTTPLTQSLSELDLR